MEQTHTTWVDRLTIWLLLVGGVIFPIVGWLIGVILLWTRGVWSYKNRLVGSLLFPGGLFAGVGLIFFGTHTSGHCDSVREFGTVISKHTIGTVISMHTTCAVQATGIALGTVAGSMLLAGLIVVPIGTAIYLSAAVRRRDMVNSI